MNDGQVFLAVASSKSIFHTQSVTVRNCDSDKANQMNHFKVGTHITETKVYLFATRNSQYHCHPSSHQLNKENVCCRCQVEFQICRAKNWSYVCNYRSSKFSSGTLQVNSDPSKTKIEANDSWCCSESQSMCLCNSKPGCLEFAFVICSLQCISEIFVSRLDFNLQFFVFI